MFKEEGLQRKKIAYFGHKYFFGSYIALFTSKKQIKLFSVVKLYCALRFLTEWKVFLFFNTILKTQIEIYETLLYCRIRLCPLIALAETVWTEYRVKCFQRSIAHKIGDDKEERIKCLVLCFWVMRMEYCLLCYYKSLLFSRETFKVCNLNFYTREVVCYFIIIFCFRSIH